MDDMISRQAAIDACLNGKCANVYDCADAIKALLSVDLDKVKQEFKQDVRAQMSSADLISRQAVIESIKRNTYRHTYLDQIIDIIKDFPSARPEPHWIPCSERLPEVGKDVMVCYDFKGHRSVLIGVLYGDEKFHGYDDEYLTPEGRKYRKAVAWMPLPEPYREERIDE